ncbi:hypothetical protein P7K49_030598, partial [Saguinus oedipus]
HQACKNASGAHKARGDVDLHTTPTVTTASEHWDTEEEARDHSQGLSSESAIPAA